MPISIEIKKLYFIFLSKVPSIIYRCPRKLMCKWPEFDPRLNDFIPDLLCAITGLSVLI